MAQRRSHLILVGLILAALAGVALLAVPGSPVHKKVVLGLDLQGGLEVVLKAVPPKGKTCDAACMDRSISIMRSRIDKLGVSEPEIRKQGTNQIVIQLAGVHDVNKAAQIIGTTAQLQFYDFEKDLTGPSTNGGQPVATASLFKLLTQVKEDASKGTPTQYYLFNKKKQVISGPEDTREKLLDAPKLNGKQPAGSTILAAPAKTTVISCAAATGCIGTQQGDAAAPLVYYLMKFDPNNPTNPVPEATGKDLKLSAITADISTQGQGNVVRLGFTGEGARKFHTITRDEAQRGAIAANAAGQTGNDPATIQQFAQHFAIVLDNELRSTPYIDYKQNPDGIDPTGTGAEISNINSFGEAKDLALVLQTGALPVEFEQIERTDVSATLGKDSLKEAKLAALIGLLVVALFLLILYRFLGVVAVIGLGIYAAFLYAAILLFGVTLTLPGFAGLVLTIGVAADANVVIFERIKEEVRAGKSVRAAIAAGYAKGFHTIIDANVVTVITAMVLFAVATAGVKGFALMLMIGVVISLITAVAATRAMLGLLAGFRWFENPRFMGAGAEQHGKWLQIDFMRRRFLWLAISGSVVVISIGALAVKGLNLGIDFKGGTQVSFTTPQPETLSSVRTQTTKFGKEPVVQGRGKSFRGDEYKSFQLRLRTLNGPQTSALKDAIGSEFQTTKIQIQTVSASFGRQIARGAIIAILFSLLLIILYIAIRFDFKFAVPVIVALVHDIVITVGVYALLGREVSNSTVAAVLTVLGYSIYDTIIIFDRIRENIPLMRRAPFATIANVSLWETIRRSLATTFITLLPVLSLLLFGGATLQDFAFALLVGIAAGAYSSIFIAAPLLTMWKEREPEYARRIGQEPPSGDGVATLEAAEEAAAAAPTPELSPVGAVERVAGANQAKRERRRQRRRAKPHGRAR
ncbi:MAG TPA: protein translocase subunit SecD [Gaiellaceae bacterium]|nr:protein translocase subunit SecD [Gaiellaceae bacterium]